MSSQKDKKKAILEDDISRVSNCVTWFLKQFEAERIEAMEKRVPQACLDISLPS